MQLMCSIIIIFLIKVFRKNVIREKFWK